MTRFFVGLWCVVALMSSPASGQSYGKLANKHIGYIEPAILQLGSGVELKDEYPFLLVRIEYPASITEAGIRALVAQTRAYQPLAAIKTDDEIRNRLLDQINKSAYFAHRLHRHFADSRRFPPETIASRGVMIDAAPSGVGVMTVPPATDVPAVLTLRFAVGRDPTVDISTANPDGTGVRAVWNSFADYVAPAMALVTEPAAWPGSGGVIAVHGSWMAQANIIQACKPPECLAARPEISDELGINVSRRAVHDNGATFAQVRGSLPFGRVGYAGVTKQGIRPVNLCSDTPGDIGVACLHEQIALALTTQALSQIDPYLATRFQFREYIKLVDPQLAMRWPGAVESSGPRQRLSFIKALMRAERSFVSAVSAKQVTNLLDGPIGGQVRLQRMSERTYAQSVVEASRTKFDLGSFLGAAATLGQFGSAFMNKDFAGQSAATLQMQRIETAPVARFRDSQAGLNAAFTTGTVQTYKELFGASYATVVAGKTLQAGSLNELRQQFSQRYTTFSFATENVSAVRCPGTTGGQEKEDPFIPLTHACLLPQ